jgi:hypothetical protein
MSQPTPSAIENKIQVSIFEQPQWSSAHEKETDSKLENKFRAQM